MTPEEERTQAQAVARAVKDALIDRDLADHARHLNEINGSQQAMATSLASVESSLTSLVASAATQAAVTNALAGEVKARLASQLSRRERITAGAALAASWAAVIAVVVTH